MPHKFLVFPTCDRYSNCDRYSKDPVLTQLRHFVIFRSAIQPAASHARPLWRRADHPTKRRPPLFPRGRGKALDAAATGRKPPTLQHVLGRIGERRVGGAAQRGQGALVARGAREPVPQSVHQLPSWAVRAFSHSSAVAACRPVGPVVPLPPGGLIIPAIWPLAPST